MPKKPAEKKIVSMETPDVMFWVGLAFILIGLGLAIGWGWGLAVVGAILAGTGFYYSTPAGEH